jgi:hypothetical protein
MMSITQFWEGISLKRMIRHPPAVLFSCAVSLVVVVGLLFYPWNMLWLPGILVSLWFLERLLGRIEVSQSPEAPAHLLRAEPEGGEAGGAPAVGVGLVEETKTDVGAVDPGAQMEPEVHEEPAPPPALPPAPTPLGPIIQATTYQNGEATQTQRVNVQMHGSNRKARPGLDPAKRQEALRQMNAAIHATSYQPGMMPSQQRVQINPRGGMRRRGT